MRTPSGKVYTQNECLEHLEIQSQFGQDRPEYTVKVTETDYWIIEAKRDQGMIAQAIQEAIDYAKRLNRSQSVRAVFVSGVAGNEASGYLIQSCFLVGKTFKPITFNGQAITSLIAPDVAARVLSLGPDINDVPIDEALFLAKAEKINEHLHLGAINLSYRARVMAALLLSLVEETQPNVNAPPSVLIHEINARAGRVLKKEGKTDFARYIEIALPTTEDNHVKFKTAIVRTIQELNALNIRSAMDSGTDVLGKFYEVFLKYGNGAKEIGIVLTPRHVTKFAVEVMGITDRDVVYDPTCGTGGFLVAAFDHVKNTSNESQVNRFKVHNIFGIEQDADVVSLAIVNMIFRGDGKNNIVEGNCFQKKIVANGSGGGGKYAKASEASPVPTGEDAVVTRVLMNPPFALPGSDDKEYKFVDHALSQMQNGGLLFSVLPYSAMANPGRYLHWRTNSLLAKNTLLSVVTFPEYLFYPLKVRTVGIFVKKGHPHDRGQNVLWFRAFYDGLAATKGKRLPRPGSRNDFPQAHAVVKAFLGNPSFPVRSKDRLQKACPIDFDDPALELVPENYLNDAPPSDAEIIKGMEQILRESVSLIISKGQRA